MNVRLTRTPLITFAACVLSGSLALSQQTPPTPAATTTPPAGAPAEGQPPQMRGAVRPDMQGHMGPQGGFHGGMDNGHGFQGGFHGPQGGPMGGQFHIGPGGMWWKNPAVVQRLALTPEQTKKMDDIFQQSRLRLIDLHADVEKQEVLLEPLLSASTLDSAKASAQIDKVADARANLEKADAKMLLGIRGVLTPDQWTKLHSHSADAGPGGPAGASGPGGPGVGRGRGMRPPAPGTGSNVIGPIGQQ